MSMMNDRTDKHKDKKERRGAQKFYFYNIKSRKIIQIDKKSNLNESFLQNLGK